MHCKICDIEILDEDQDDGLCKDCRKAEAYDEHMENKGQAERDER